MILTHRNRPIIQKIKVPVVTQNLWLSVPKEITCAASTLNKEKISLRILEFTAIKSAPYTENIYFIFFMPIMSEVKLITLNNKYTILLFFFH